MQDVELVNVALRGLPKSWEPFVQGIYAQETVPVFDRLWNDCSQDGTHLEFGDGLERSHDDIFSLVSQERKGKFKKISSGELTTQDGKKKKYMTKFNCFACHKFGNYAGKCPHMKKGGNEMHSEGSCIEKYSIG
jgi:hypothetical protein